MIRDKTTYCLIGVGWSSDPCFRFVDTELEALLIRKIRDWILKVTTEWIALQISNFKLEDK